MAYRLARSLINFRSECNARWPTRDKASDGWIGDAAHASRRSDHNPWVKDSRGVGVVRAYDLDAGHGLNREAGLWIADHIRELGRQDHPALGVGAYVISDRRIASDSLSWTWRRYSGSNPHISHTHVSVGTAPSSYDSDQSWNISSLAAPPLPSPGSGDGPTGILRRGSKGDAVKALQRVLNRWYPSLKPLVADGDFGPATEARVKYFQQRAHLTVDGIVGPQSKAVLNL
jgi:hypothetical protein